MTIAKKEKKKENKAHLQEASKHYFCLLFLVWREGGCMIKDRRRSEAIDAEFIPKRTKCSYDVKHQVIKTELFLHTYQTHVKAFLILM